MTEACCSPGRDSDQQVDLRPPGSEKAGAKYDSSLVTLPADEFLMGTDDGLGYPADGEGPARRQAVEAFAIAPHTVTNRQFRAFVEESGHVTDAERFGWSYVFAPFLSRATLRSSTPHPTAPWWAAVGGATWATPEGPGSLIEDRLDHPVVHVSWNDARSYVRWAGGRLPTEAEWEYAARGGLEQKTYVWGDEFKPDGRTMCNIFEGEFPHKNTAEDGYAGTAPVGAFPPNGFGLYNMAGNVWEWCFDQFSVSHSPAARGRGALPDISLRVVRGGSYLCHDSYCNRYRVAARTGNTANSSSGNTGFRMAADR